MATTTQTVIIDFQADYSSLEAGIDVLERTGKVDAELAATFKRTNAEIGRQGAAFKSAATASGASTQSFTKLNQLMQQFPKSGLNRFLLQVGKELAGAGVQAKDFYTKLDPKDAVTKQASLRGELKQVKDQMQQAALAGGVLGEEYKRLKQRAGELDDTIKDVANDIANAGSDTRGVDNLVGSISALAGGFSAVQGAVALFGDESEDLQKTLLRVNAAMALATGIQQVLNATTKQGALTRVADAAATGLQIAAQKIYTFVTGRATAATVAFKVALAATGIGLVIVAVIALANAFKSSTKDIDDATDAIDRQNRSLESMNTLIEQQLSISLARAEAAGAAESRLIAIRGKSLQEQRKNLIESNALLGAQRDGLSATSEAYGKLNNAIEENNAAIKEIDTQTVVASLNLQKALADEAKRANDEATAKAKEAAEKARAEAAKQRALAFADNQAAIELQLLQVAKGSAEELELQKDLLRKKLQIDLEAEDLTLNQRRLLIQRFFKERKELEKKSNAELTQESITEEQSRLQAQLSNLNLVSEERVELQVESLRLSAAQEILSADGNAAKIREINAKLQADIVAVKVAAIQQAADYEIALASAQGGTARRALEAVSANEKLKADVRINAIQQLGDREQAELDRQIKANRDAAAIQGSDQQALALIYEQLLDQKRAKAEKTEQDITKITLDETEKRKAADISYIQATVGALQQVADIAATIQQQEEEASDAAITRQRRELEELLEAGAITEKEARESRRRIDGEERAAKQKAAQQSKNLAVFNAVLAIPQAYIAGLTAPFPVGGPLYGAILAGLAGLQAGLIAAKPVPKFATGKKGSYSGAGIVGDAGAELVHRADGSMWVADKPTLTYLGSRDKVFTAGETKQMLPFVNKEAIAAKPVTEGFDYNKMAAAMKHKPSNTTVNIDKEFISESVANGLSKVQYLDRYYFRKL